VIDCCTKECIGYALADHMRAGSTDVSVGAFS
jgi:hypothetical protein